MGWEDITFAPDHLSSSQLSMYVRCARQFEFRYIKGIKRPPNLNMAVGTSVHKSAEVNYAHKLKTKKPVKLSVAMDAYDSAFRKARLDTVKDEPEGKAKDRGYAMAEAHYNEIAPKYQPLEKPEFEFTVAIPGVRRKLYGFMDLIAAPIMRVGKELVALKKRSVRDNKTSGRRYDQFAVEVAGQLTAYAWAHKVLFGKLPDSLGFDITIAKKDSEIVEVQRETTMRTDAEIKRFAETVQHIERGINSGVFPPVDDAKTCSWCGYKELCLGPAATRAKKFNWK